MVTNSRHLIAGDVMIGVEFCANGSLQDYFKEKRNVFQTLDGSLEAESS